MVELLPSKQVIRVRFPSPAPAPTRCNNACNEPPVGETLLFRQALQTWGSTDEIVQRMLSTHEWGLQIPVARPSTGATGQQVTAMTKNSSRRAVLR